MKIAIIGPVYPLRGGIADFNHALANALVAQGHQVKIFSFSLQYPKLLFPGKSQYTDSAPSNIQYETEALINTIQPRTWGKSAKAIADYEPDLVLTRFWIPFIAPALGTIHKKLKRKIQAPIIAITDNVIPHEKRPGDRMLSRFFLKTCDAFIVMSKQVGEDLKKMVDNPTYSVIPHPIYDIFGDIKEKAEARKNLDIKEHDNIILFFGFIRKYKGLDLLIRSFAKTDFMKLNIKLLVAGEFYESKTDYIKLINRLGLEEHVIIHDKFIDNQSVANYFCAADLVAQTYITATQSGVTQIAYNFYRPMLVTDVGGLSEIVEHQKNGYVCPVDKNKIATALMDFFMNKREEAFSKATIELKEKFSWNHFTTEVLALTERILQHKKINEQE